MIVVDTHVWVWLVSHPERLSPRARKHVNRAIKEKAVYVSCISAWEVALLAATGRLQFTLQVAEWIAWCETLPFLNFMLLKTCDMNGGGAWESNPPAGRSRAGPAVLKTVPDTSPKAPPYPMLPNR